jgi:hypothetical protein
MVRGPVRLTAMEILEGRHSRGSRSPVAESSADPLGQPSQRRPGVRDRIDSCGTFHAGPDVLGSAGPSLLLRDEPEHYARVISSYIEQQDAGTA